MNTPIRNERILARKAIKRQLRKAGVPNQALFDLAALRQLRRTACK